jgi:c-di-GMP-binding flagellar brake protein YcgR
MSVQPGKAPRHSLEHRRRRHPRHRADFPVVIKIFTNDEYQQMEGHCNDLSEAGMGVLSAAELAVGEVVSLKFPPPGSSESWEQRAVVRQRRGYHYGFEFISISSEQVAFLRNQLSHLARSD